MAQPAPSRGSALFLLDMARRHGRTISPAMVEGYRASLRRFPDEEA